MHGDSCSFPLSCVAPAQALWQLCCSCIYPCPDTLLSCSQILSIQVTFQLDLEPPQCQRCSWWMLIRHTRLAIFTLLANGGTLTETLPFISACLPCCASDFPFMCFSGSLFVDISGPCVFLKQEFWVTIAASFFPPQVHFSQRIFVSQSTHRLYVENLPKISAQVHLSSRRLNLHSDIYKNNFVLQYVLHVHLRSRYLAGSALPVVFQVRSNYVLLWICCWEKRKI